MAASSTLERSDSDFSDSDISEEQVDIFDTLANISKDEGRGNVDDAKESDSEADDAQFIQREIEKRNKKGGTRVTKAVSAKGKLAKGAVGGGSFQSMGESGCARWLNPKSP